MLRKEIINGEQYYCHYIDGNVGDIFQDWREIPSQKEKLIQQIYKHKMLIDKQNNT